MPIQPNNNGGDDDGSKDVSLFARRMLAEGVAPVADASRPIASLDIILRNIELVNFPTNDSKTK